MAKKTFCLDVSTLDKEQRTEFAETLKTTVDEFNKTLDTEEMQDQEPNEEEDSEE